MPKVFLEDLVAVFINEVWARTDWRDGNISPKAAVCEIKTFSDTVHAAGFNVAIVIPGKLELDNQAYQLCPYKAVDDKGNDDYFATAWLDAALRLVLSETKNKKSKAELIEMICSEIRRIRSLKPQLMFEGELLVM